MARSKILAPHVLELLASTDELVVRSGASWASLKPKKKRALSLVELGEVVLEGVDPALLHEQQASAWAMAMSHVTRAIVRHFPDNIFVDLDLVAVALRDVVIAEGHVALEQTIDPLVEIHRLYGKSSRIRFQYVHDFLYGFDWARWVLSEPKERGAIGPFDRRFLQRSVERAHELEALIAKDDATYPAIAPNTFRNPYGFERDPKSERALFLDLAKHNLLPACPTRMSAIWDAPFTQGRLERAKQLGLLHVQNANN
jgi:hypothetical protein